MNKNAKLKINIDILKDRIKYVKILELIEKTILEYANTNKAELIKGISFSGIIKDKNDKQHNTYIFVSKYYQGKIELILENINELFTSIGGIRNYTIEKMSKKDVVITEDLVENIFNCYEILHYFLYVMHHYIGKIIKLRNDNSIIRDEIMDNITKMNGIVKNRARPDTVHGGKYTIENIETNSKDLSMLLQQIESTINTIIRKINMIIISDIVDSKINKDDPSYLIYDAVQLIRNAISIEKILINYYKSFNQSVLFRRERDFFRKQKKIIINNIRNLSDIQSASSTSVSVDDIKLSLFSPLTNQGIRGIRDIQGTRSMQRTHGDSIVNRISQKLDGVSKDDLQTFCQAYLTKGAREI